MKRLFILGSGFSKAVSVHMPTITELAAIVDLRGHCLDGSIIGKLGHDIEALLTYLVQASPWKSREQELEHKAAYLRIVKQIVSRLRECEERAFAEEPPGWAMEFVNHLHLRVDVVISLNYDTVLERLSKDLKNEANNTAIATSDLYQLPLVHVVARTTPLWGRTPERTFQLNKIHGSTNWYSGEDESTLTGQVYFTPVTGRSPSQDAQENLKTTVEANAVDLAPLIIPPVMDKASLYRLPLVRAMWVRCHAAIREAEEIYCVGYSIPRSDQAVRLFLSTVAMKPMAKVFVVNSAGGASAGDLLGNYQQAFNGCEVDTQYLGGEDAVERMVKDLIRRTKTDGGTPDQRGA